MPDTRKVTVELNADPSMLVVACTAVRAFAKAVGMGDKELQRMELATDEACTNVICHAYADDATRIYRIEAERVDDALEVRVYDRGEGFDIQAVPHPDTKCGLAEIKIGGLGLFLCKKMMDEVSYSRTPDGENCLRMVKRIEGEPARAAG